MTGSHSEISFEGLPTDDPQIRQPDIARAKEILDWTPSVDRKEGLVKSLDYFKTQVNK